MSDQAAQNTASATVDTGFESYRTSKRSTSDTSQTQSADDGEKSAGLGTGNEQETKGLTDEQKADRKKRNDERRERRWFEERGQMREQMRRLEQELSDLKANNGASRTREAATSVPPLKEYLASGKFKTYEDAVDARQADIADEIREEMRQERSAGSEEQNRQADARTFQKNIKEFTRTHEDFPDAFDAVREALDNNDGSGTPVTAYLVKAKDGAALIYHLGNNPELLEELSDMDPEDAIAELGAIRKELKGQKSPSPETHQPNTPKAPQRVAGRQTPPDSLTAQRQATERNDFQGYREAKRARQAGK